MRIQLGLSCVYFLLLAGFAADRLSASESVAYVSVAGEKRIAILGFDPQTGELSRQGELKLPGEPGALAIGASRRTLYVGMRSTGRLATLRVADDGSLSPLSEIAAAADPAYVSVDRRERFLLSAYYVAGKIAVHTLDQKGRLGADRATWTPTADKAHAIVLDPSNRFLLVPHTGPNAIFQFRFSPSNGRVEANTPPRVATRVGTGPRHVLFHPRLPVVYSVNEQGGSVSVFCFDREKGTIARRATLSTLPAEFAKNNACADLELTPDGRFLYASNRGHDSLAVFRVQPSDGDLERVEVTPTEPTPRQFNIDPTGRYLVSAGQSSGRLAVFQINADTGSLQRRHTFEVGKTPWWILITKTPAGR